MTQITCQKELQVASQIGSTRAQNATWIQCKNMMIGRPAAAYVQGQSRIPRRLFRDIAGLQPAVDRVFSKKCTQSVAKK